MPVSNSIAVMQDEVAEWRHRLHENPQTCYEEEFAASFVAEKLTLWGIPFKGGLAKTGIVATIAGQRTDSGRALAFRADMDALDIVEKSGVAHASKIPGKMHACGHDGHTATLLGVARHLSETRNFNGTVHLIFQPAEEGGGGAMRMIDDGVLRDFPVDAIYGLHNWPYLEAGKIASRRGPLMGSADFFDVVVTGKGGHAAAPDKAVDPIVAGAQIVAALQSVVSRNVDPLDQAVITVTGFEAGAGAYNVIPDSARLIGTFRAFRRETRDLLERRLREVAAGIGAALGVDVAVTIFDSVDPTINSDAETDFAMAAAADIVGADNVIADVTPVMLAEDFGAYLKDTPGCFIAVGQAARDEDSPHSYGLHSPHYDFNDDIIPIGMSWFTRLAEKHMPL